MSSAKMVAILSRGEMNINHWKLMKTHLDAFIVTADSTEPLLSTKLTQYLYSRTMPILSH